MGNPMKGGSRLCQECLWGGGQTCGSRNKTIYQGSAQRRRLHWSKTKAGPGNTKVIKAQKWKSVKNHFPGTW